MASKFAHRLLFLLLLAAYALFPGRCEAAFPIHPAAATASTPALATKPPTTIADYWHMATDRRYKFHSYGSGQKSGLPGILSFVAAMLSFVALIIAAIVVYVKLPQNLATLAVFTIPSAMYFYLALCVVLSAAAFILGLIGVKRKHAGFAIAGLIIGAIMLLAGFTILSNV
jgi:hypothetical protein